MPFPHFAPAPLGFLWSTLAAILLIPLLLLYHTRSLASLGADVRTGKLSREHGVRRVQQTTRIGSAILVLATGGIGTLILWSSLWTPDTIPIGGCLCLWGLVSVVPLLLYALLLNQFITPRARTQIRDMPRPTPEAIGSRAKVLLLRYGLALLFIETLGLCYWLNVPEARWGLPIAAALLPGLRAYWGARIHRWLNRVIPIGATSWAALEPRIRAWAARAEVQVQAIDIQQGGAASAARDGRRGNALFLNGRLLEQTDWRQRDAIVSHELGHLRLGHLRVTALIEMLKNGVQAACCVALNLEAPPAWLTSLANRVAQTSDLGTQLIRSDLLLLGLSLLALAIASLSFLGRGRRYRIELACDRFSAELTGDPLAMMVALNTIKSLLAIPPKMRGRTHPPIEQRILALAVYMGEQRPAAPWAKTLVPSKIPFILKQKCFTIPLDQAPPPGPVDAAPGNILTTNP